jgi:hypothetical protein
MFLMAIYTGDSILQIIAANITMPAGAHTFTANGVSYAVNVARNDSTNQTWGSMSFGSTTADNEMVIVIVQGNLTINSGATITTQVRKRGFLLYVTGTLTNNGTISMTARGAIAAGQNVHLYRNLNGTYETVPAVGATGGVGVPLVSGLIRKNHGLSGTGRQSGGGGSGACRGTGALKGGDGSSGTSYSGGSGGGGSYSVAESNTQPGQNAAVNGGKGGNASAKSVVGTVALYSVRSSGGAGNPAGSDAYAANSNATNVGNESANTAQAGTGGLLIIFANIVNNNGNIQSNGSNVGPRNLGVTRHAGGGASGGGSINVFYRSSHVRGTITANGGVSTGFTGLISDTGAFVNEDGGSGGNGTVTVTQMPGNISLPANVVTNGITARVTASHSNPVSMGTQVTLTVNLSGTAEISAKHSIRLKSTQANLNPVYQEEICPTRQTVSVSRAFSFTMPAQNITDLTLEHFFEALHQILVEVGTAKYTYDDITKQWVAVS